jgi:hypothetical protein
VVNRQRGSFDLYKTGQRDLHLFSRKIGCSEKKYVVKRSSACYTPTTIRIDWKKGAEITVL